MSESQPPDYPPQEPHAAAARLEAERRAAPPGWEQATFEKLMFATLREQRATRRWRTFTRLAWLLFFIFLIWGLMHRSSPSSDKSLPFTAAYSWCRSRVLVNEPRPVPAHVEPRVSRSDQRDRDKEQVRPRLRSFEQIAERRGEDDEREEIDGDRVVVVPVLKPERQDPREPRRHEHREERALFVLRRDEHRGDGEDHQRAA